jgi:hypothetical protein
MITRIEWRTAFWARRGRATALSAPGPVLSRERIRELDQPTWLRRNLCIAELAEPRRGL